MHAGSTSRQNQCLPLLPQEPADQEPYNFVWSPQVGVC